MKLLPGLSFSWQRATGISQARSRIAKSIGIPTSRCGMERKIGGALIRAILSIFK